MADDKKLTVIASVSRIELKGELKEGYETPSDNLYLEYFYGVGGVGKKIDQTIPNVAKRSQLFCLSLCTIKSPIKFKSVVSTV